MGGFYVAASSVKDVAYQPLILGFQGIKRIQIYSINSTSYTQRDEMLDTICMKWFIKVIWEYLSLRKMLLKGILKYLTCKWACAMRPTCPD